MTIPTFHLTDMVNIYDAPTYTNVGVTSGGTTIVAGSCLVALLPLTNEEAMTIGGGFNRTRIRMLSEPTLNCQPGAQVVVLTSNIYVGTARFQVEGAPQLWPDPLNVGSAFMKETILIQEH